MIDINECSLDCIPLSQVISARKGEFETGFERGGQTRCEKSILVWHGCFTNSIKHVCFLPLLYQRLSILFVVASRHTPGQ